MLKEFDMAIELHVRFGDYVGEPRKVYTTAFETEAERRAFIDGMYSLWQHTRGEYQITEKLPDGRFAPDPLHDGFENEEVQGADSEGSRGLNSRGCQVNIDEIRNIIERAIWNARDLEGHTHEEFLRANAPARMWEQIDALDALEITPRFAGDMEHREYARGACERQIERWMAAQQSCSSGWN